jgi:hypothetical protein
MIFKFPKKKIVLDCFTYSEAVAIRTPISPASQHMPEWWKELPRTETSLTLKRNMKRCSGLIDYYKASIAIPLWSDLAISVEGQEYSWQFADMSSSANIHPAYQRGTWLPESEYGHVKLESPWLLTEKEGINWVWTQPVYGFDAPDRVIAPPAILNFYYQNTASVNLMLGFHRQGKFILPVGLPMAFITPMSDRKVDVKIHVVTKEQFFSKKLSCVVFDNSYWKTVKLIDAQKCPFGFDK